MSDVQNNNTTMIPNPSNQCGFRKHLRRLGKPARDFLRDVKDILQGQQRTPAQPKRLRNKLRKKQRVTERPKIRKAKLSTKKDAPSSSETSRKDELFTTVRTQELPAIDCSDFSEEVEDQFEQSLASIELDSSFDSQPTSQASTQVGHPLHTVESITTLGQSRLSKNSEDGGVKLPSSTNGSEAEASPILASQRSSHIQPAMSISSEPSPFADEYNYAERDGCVSQTGYEGARLQVAEELGPYNLTTIDFPTAIANLRRMGLVARDQDGNLEPIRGVGPRNLSARVSDNSKRVTKSDDPRSSRHATNGSNESSYSSRVNHYGQQESNEGCCSVPTHVSPAAVNNERSSMYR